MLITHCSLGRSSASLKQAEDPGNKLSDSLDSFLCDSQSGHFCLISTRMERQMTSDYQKASLQSFCLSHPSKLLPKGCHLNAITLSISAVITVHFPSAVSSLNPSGLPQQRIGAHHSNHGVFKRPTAKEKAWQI